MSIYGIAITLILALVAELFRFNGYLLLDLWVPIFAGAWLAYKAWNKNLFPLPKIVWPAALFILFGFASLLLNSGEMSTGEFISSAAFSLRWAAMFALGILVSQEPKPIRNKIMWMVFVFAALLSIAGFIQLQIQPDFTTLEVLGWDPHQGRLLSTWFDPNFVGGFLAFILPIILGAALEKNTKRSILLLLAGVIFVALVLTLSRSSYLALLTGILVLGLLRSWKLLALFFISLVLLTAVVQPFQERVLALTDSASALLTQTYTLPDDSARLRIDSWEEGWQLFVQKPVFGHGYNRYDFATLELGTLNQLEDHAASGSDSSLLTVLATTGLAGFLPFFAIYLILAKLAYQNRKSGKKAGFLAALCGLFVHSIFVNSLLFPLFMLPFWLVLGAVLGDDLP